VIWEGINDDERHARALAKFCKIIPSKVNLIQYNPIDEGEFRQAKQEAVDMYVRILESQAIIAKVRKSRGQDIDAACGQLANKNEVGELSEN
jgi:23S rRNA (adenine2503-C2)-methyltransferase